MCFELPASEKELDEQFRSDEEFEKISGFCRSKQDISLGFFSLLFVLLLSGDEGELLILFLLESFFILCTDFPLLNVV